jgi:hypothetical protein
MPHRMDKESRWADRRPHSEEGEYSSLGCFKLDYTLCISSKGWL